MAKDLVCGIELEEEANCAAYAGKRHYFCGDVCRAEFLNDPVTYLEADEENGFC